MMTGQILGGSFPLTAIKYQMAIVVCIVSAMLAAAVINLLLCHRPAFDAYGMVRENCFAKKRPAQT